MLIVLKLLKSYKRYCPDIRGERKCIQDEYVRGPPKSTYKKRFDPLNLTTKVHLTMGEQYFMEDSER